MSVTEEHRGGKLNRTVGFYGLMFVSLGSIIGSGWLLGALTAAETAGPASIISWVLAAAMLATLALVYAELGATYPVAGGSGRFPYYSHGPIVGFIGGWAAWVQAVFIAPIEVLAAITYVNSVNWVNDHFAMLGSDGLLNTRGLVIAVILMVLFTAMNLAGAEFMSESNVLLVIWKTAVPFLAIGVIASLSFHPGNFTAGGGFMPHGWHGVFAALPVGVVFALQGSSRPSAWPARGARCPVPCRAPTRAVCRTSPSGSLHLSDGDRPRQYRMPWPKMLLPIAFVSANLILYWGGYNVNLKVVGAIAVGLAVFVIGSVVNRTHAFSTFRNSWWIPVWLGGVLLIGRFGRYGDPTLGGLQRHTNDLPAFVDLGVVIAFSPVIYYVALAMGLEPSGVSEEVAKDAHQLAGLDELTTA
jgi:amino acid transporter